MGIPRPAAARRLRALLREYPVVSILGPRQAGKTTLARTAFPRAPYWDLDLPSDRGRLEISPEGILRSARPPAVIDEAQRMPDLFPVLRALVDEDRRRTGRFLLLGSASPDLVRGLSETLAGRIAFMELAPFSPAEVGAARLGRLWERGGFPPAFLAPGDGAWRRWIENYVRTFVERDLGLLGLDLPAPRLHRFARLLAHAHGGIWNASEAGAALGISYHTAQRYAEVLAQGFLVRFLPPWHANLGTRLVRRPKVYWRDTGLLHHHLGLDSPGGIRDHPKAGASWEGFVIEAILGRERAARPATEGFFFRTHAGLECDLLLDRGRERVAVEMKIGPPDRRDADRLRAVMKITGARRGIVVTRDGRSSSTGAGGRAGPVAVWRAEDLFQYRRR